MNSIKFGGVEFRFYNHLYAVSRDGKVLKNLQIREPKKRPDGYLAIGRQQLVHRMVALCWLDKPEGAHHVHHKNHNKGDNRASNLEWLTPLQHGREHRENGAYVRTEETKQKLRAFRLGRKTAEETKARQREASLRNGATPPPRPVGYKCSAEAVSKMIENSPNATACQVNGITYKSFSEAGRALGEKPHTVRKRCLSQNFPDYKVKG